LAEANGSNQILRYYVYGQGLLAMVTPSGASYSYHYDATGNTVAMTDGSQAVVNRYAYTPYGQIVGKAESVPQPFQYVGQSGVMAEPNGFYYMRARYYDPEVGRFVSEDPIGFEGGDVNLYAYVGGNPVMFVDPEGLLNLRRVLSGTAMAVGGAVEIYGAATMEVGTVGMGTAAAVGLAGFGVPAFSAGVSEIIAGVIETEANPVRIPPVSAPAVATLVATGDLNLADTVDFFTSVASFAISGMPTRPPRRSDAVGTAAGGAGIVERLDRKLTASPCGR